MNIYIFCHLLFLFLTGSDEMSDDVKIRDASLGMMVPVIKCIMIHLPMMDLNNCSKVCKLWNDIAKCMKQERKDIFWYCELLLDQNSSNSEHTDGECSPLEQSFSLQSKAEVAMSLTRTLRNSRSQPKLALLFPQNTELRFYLDNYKFPQFIFFYYVAKLAFSINFPSFIQSTDGIPNIFQVMSTAICKRTLENFTFQKKCCTFIRCAVQLRGTKTSHHMQITLHVTAPSPPREESYTSVEKVVTFSLSMREAVEGDVTPYYIMELTRKQRRIRKKEVWLDILGPKEKAVNIKVLVYLQVVFTYCNVCTLDKIMLKKSALRTPTSPLMSDQLVSSLPKNCLGLGALSYHGVIGTTQDGHLIEAEVVEGISALFVPEIPGVEFLPFLLGKTHKTISVSAIDDEMLTKLTNIKPGKEVKCLLLFSSDYRGKHTELVTALTSQLFARQKNSFAIGGGYLENVLALQGLCGIDKCRIGAKEQTLGIAICGDNVEAASTISDGEIESVESALNKLKSCGFKEKNLIGLMFACCSRGKDFYNKSNVEADLFRKTFPTTPLFGFFGSGEIGFQKIPNEIRTSKRQKVDITDEDIIHSYTTVFILLSFYNN
ncbi:F-box only protein 22 [Nymphon striatum]|nr:F-box only protein 22 [Nymphon striatum]KAG1672336.1 F-box only protein 22 [Nymphon striatum]